VGVSAPAPVRALDPVSVRARFPSLAREQAGRPVVFLDGPGGTQVPDRVIDAVAGYYRDTNANDGGAFVTSRLSSAMAHEAHAAVADLYGAVSPEEIKLGANMTTLTFHVSRSIGAALAPGDEVVVTTLDHDANVTPWRLMAADRGLTVRTVDIRAEDGTLDLASFDAALGPRTRLVAVGYASNALGTINPIAELIARAHAVGAWTYVDAVHFAPHGPIDVVALGTDFLVSSAYKWFGPHVGALYGKADLLERLPAYKVRPAHDRFETGTPNYEGIAGTLAAVEYLADIGRDVGAPRAARRPAVLAGMAAIATHERELSVRLLAGLAAIPGVRTWGITDPARVAERTPTVSVTVAGHSPRAVATALGEAGIFAWDGDFYATGLIERLGLAASGGVVRLGLVHYSTAEEVDRALDELDRIAASPAGSLPEAPGSH
jgi:cysteine desulfurase family protein (TIGR01976 family)